MALFVLDVTTAKTSDLWSQITTLDGRDYTFNFAWNKRAGAWFMDVGDQDGEPIASGVKLVCGAVLLDGVVDSRKWPGSLLCFALSATDDSDPGHDDFGTRVKLYYLDQEG